ncbi:DUF349 domain-containing protein [Rothia nasimurium]|uniref:DUF349 domain-containing protein n=1 Tax=Rothia nasimurium TaxID=85336 RepID=A0A4Y9F5B5_9MICC|nr:DUF349 domain-containing protein [Rothia nasimurium]MBF0808099.1 DUF349 domain-containing protein [Rothia nasimurium]TFU22526.1 DUF349 domain-containing protein [Rothia nasimurium]
MTTQSDDTTLNVDLDKARKFGRVDEDGHVFVIVDGEEYAVGQVPGASTDEALGYFARKFENFEAQVALLEERVERKAKAADLQKAAAHLGQQVAVRNMVGDYAALQERLVALVGKINEREEAEKTESAEARQAALEAREAIVSEAEAIVAKDDSAIHWKNSHARMNELFEEWKKTQKEHHLAKSIEDELWKRFRAARTSFDRRRRAHFSQLDEANAKAKRVKEALIAEAEALQTSTDWAATAAKYRDLMDQWKAAPRGTRKEDDALWARFRAAQDVFFDARTAVNAELDKEFEANLQAKEALLEEARGILPVTDIAVAKKALEGILDRWEAIGRVPRNSVRRVEQELRKVQDEIHRAENAKWQRTDPAKQARANSMLTQLEDAIAGLEADLAKAEASGNDQKIKKAQEALDARKQWLETLKASSAEFGA